jgi:hypothetical protein
LFFHVIAREAKQSGVTKKVWICLAAALLAMTAALSSHHLQAFLLDDGGELFSLRGHEIEYCCGVP